MLVQLTGYSKTFAGVTFTITGTETVHMIDPTLILHDVGLKFCL